MTKRTTVGTTRILQWNARGLMDKKAELIKMIEEKDIDIIAITETNLTKPEGTKIRGFNSKHVACTKKRKTKATHIAPNNPPGGGLAIYVKENHEILDYSHTAYTQTAKIQAK